MYGIFFVQYFKSPYSIFEKQKILFMVNNLLYINYYNKWIEAILSIIIKMSRKMIF